MSMREAVLSCFKKYFQFSGRARRAEFWKFVGFLILVQIALLLINSLLFGPQLVSESNTVFFAQDGTQSVETRQKLLYNGGIAGNIALIASVVPLFATSWRRLHDVSMPGWLILLPWLIVLVVLITMTLTTIGWSNAVDALMATGNVHVQMGDSNLGWMSLLIVLLSFLAILALLAGKSTPTENKYGMVPHGVIPT